METKILKLLKEHSDTFLSGEDLSRKLKVSRTAIWKHIQNLKELGYEIIAQPHLGYRLTSIPDSLLPDEITYKLKAKRLASKVISYKSTDSTNNVAMLLARQGSEEGLLVISEEQTGGRGRLGRHWTSPKNSNIYMSLVLRPRIQPAEAGRITLMSAVSIAHTINRFVGLPAKIKWPNDIYLDRDKVCGILTEMSAELDRINFIVLGIGINVNADKHKLPHQAASLKMKSGRRINRVEFLKEVLHDLDTYYDKIVRGDFSRKIDDWRNYSLTLGKREDLKVGRRKIEGQAMDVDENGALIVRDDFGFNHHVLSGDVGVRQ